MKIKDFFDSRTYTMTYVVFDESTKDAIVIDPVLDYDPAASKTWAESTEAVLAFIKKEGLNLHYVLETHAHADHLSGSQLFKEHYPEAKIAIGSEITKVQEVFKGVFALGDDFKTDGSQFDLLLKDGETVTAGSLSFKVIFTPGHTPACASYLFGDALFTGDALFMPDSGTGRCDFPAGSAEDLYNSIHGRLYNLPDETRVFVGHDYQPNKRNLEFETTIGASKAKNIQLTGETSKEDFMRFRDSRDATLNAPKLLFQSVQVNIDAGRLPAPGPDGLRHLKMPLNLFKA